jgi:hypothetical protein
MLPCCQRKETDLKTPKQTPKQRKAPKRDGDEYKLRRFVSKIGAEAKRRFNSEGECYLDIEVRDTRKVQTPAANLPVPHVHLLKGDKEWREAISRLLCNASSALERLNTTFRIYEHNKNREDNLMALGADIARLQAEAKVAILYSPVGIFPALPEGLVWCGPKWETSEELRESFCETKGLWEEDRKAVVAHVAKAIAKLGSQAGCDTDTFAVIIRDGNARVYYAGKPKEGK